MFQFTSGLYLTNQLYSKNISVLFKSMTTALICFLCSLISTSISVYHVTSLFLISSTLKTLNNLSIHSVLILSSFTSCLLISVWMHLESTSACSHKFFLFNVLIFVCTFNSLSLSFL